MTREEFLKHAEEEIDQAFKPAKGRLMNLVQQAWAEGKKNAEMSHIDEIGTDILEHLKKKLEEESPHVYIDPPSITVPYTPPVVSDKLNWNLNDIPSGCRNCPNHPSNGGSGICHCIIGTQPVMCSSTATDICTAIEKDKMNASDEVMAAIGGLRDKEVYNTCCDNHIKIIHDMMTGVKKTEDEDGRGT